MRMSLLTRVHALILAAGSVSTIALLALPNAAQAEGCPNAAFRTGPSLHLPDCRAYEMVTPSGTTNGVTATFTGDSPDGSAVIVGSRGAFAGDQNNLGTGGVGNFYSLRRTESGWTTTPLAPPGSEYIPDSVGGDEFGQGSLGSLDTLTTLWLDRGVSQPDNSLDIYRENADGAFTEVGPLVPPTAPPVSANELYESGGIEYGGKGLSDDASHVIFGMIVGKKAEEEGVRWPFDATKPGFGSLFEYVGTGNTTPMLVGVNSEGSQISQCGTTLGGGNQNRHNAVSADGGTVFFTAQAAGGGCGGSGPPVDEVFARIDSGLPDAHTVAISEPSVEDCLTCDTESRVLANARFEGASADGSKVFFSTMQPLLGNDTSENLYEYDFDAPPGERVIRVSAGDSTVPSSAAAEVQGTAVQVSEDGSHVYFVATGALTSTPNGQGQAAQAGADNLYVFERDAQFPAGHTEFVADLCSNASASGSVPDARCPSSLNAEGLANDLALFRVFEGGGADVTPDGRFLVFPSYGDLTPDDTSSARQVFEYDALTGSLVRVSVGQNGFNDDGNTAVQNATIRSPNYEFSDLPGSYWSRLTVSADGSFVFFESGDGLTPRALNNVTFGVNEFGETPYMQNVYEYHEGNVSLISDGQDIGHDIIGQSYVRLDGTDESGRDVFFETGDGLVPQDINGHVDVYDARVDGGFPAPPALPGCSGDACQGALSSAPTLLSPGSEFQAGGNPPLAVSAPAAVSRPKALSAAQKLADALKACKKDKSKKQRTRCAKQAERKYATTKKAKKSTHGKGSE